MPRTPGTSRPPLAELSPNSRSRIVGARDNGVKISEITQNEGYSNSTIRSVLNNASHQVSYISKPRARTPSLLSLRDQRSIFRLIQAKPKITAAQLARELPIPVSKKTIYRFLKKSSIQKWRCSKRPLLNDKLAGKQLIWAFRNNSQSVAFWRRWIWSDECSIERRKGGKWDFVYRKRVQGKPSRGQTIMFWGCFGHNCRTDLVVMRGDPDSEHGEVIARRYLEIFEQYLPTVLDSDSIFMQDNAPIHTAHIIRDWFEEMAITVEDWPPYSPDMNPIENV
ncbi:hypothetical protein B7463_g7705, partial [Scytalidium lignicola]